MIVDFEFGAELENLKLATANKNLLKPHKAKDSLKKIEKNST